MSAVQAKSIAQLNLHEALISINEPNESPYPLQIYRGSESVITLHVKDNPNPKTIEEQDRVINDEQAKLLVRFIGIHRHKDFIVHCAAGVSRSAAVALFINIIYGHELKDNFFSTSIPNRYVLQKLLEIYQVTYREQFNGKEHK